MQVPSSTGAATQDSAARIRTLNDSFRRTFVGGTVVLTSGVDALSIEVKAEVVRRVRAFEDFGRDNDPHGEHDFLSFAIAGQTFFAKIDYYNRDMTAGSENPADPAQTTRVLTIMLAEEY